MQKKCTFFLFSYKKTERFGHFSHFYDLNSTDIGIKFLSGRYQNFLEAELLRFANTLLDSAHRTDLSRQSHFTRQTHIFVKSDVGVGREHCRHNGQVDSRVVHAQTARDVQEYIFLDQFESDPFLQHCQQHVQAAQIKTG